LRKNEVKKQWQKVAKKEKKPKKPLYIFFIFFLPKLCIVWGVEYPPHTYLCELPQIIFFEKEFFQN